MCRSLTKTVRFSSLKPTKSQVPLHTNCCWSTNKNARRQNVWRYFRRHRWVRYTHDMMWKRWKNNNSSVIKCFPFQTQLKATWLCFIVCSCLDASDGKGLSRWNFSFLNRFMKFHTTRQKILHECSEICTFLLLFYDSYAMCLFMINLSLFLTSKGSDFYY